MIGIYNEEFIKFLKDNLGEIKITTNNIICRCPYCEMDNSLHNHFHCYISKELPIFHCFHSKCIKKSGNISNLVKKINSNGIDISDKFIDKEILNNSKLIIQNNKSNINNNLNELSIPILNEDNFKLKSLYVKNRLGFNINIKSIKNMIFDICEFYNLNKNIIIFNDSFIKLKDYLQNNFIGFITNNHGLLFLRNIDKNAPFKHYKIKLQDSKFIDYYKLNGMNYNSNHIILAEGVFDIWSEYLINSLNIKENVKLYASVLSSNYSSLIKSIVFNENIYRLGISILSDRDVKIEYYKKLKKYNEHIINNLTIYYNKCGKDFNDFPLIIEKFII